MLFDTDKFAPNCEKCKRFQKAKNPKIGLSGEGKKKILILTSSPSMLEDRNNECMNDLVGEDFEKLLKTQKINLKKDCWMVPSCRCYTSKNPTLMQIDCCTPLLRKTIEEIKPKHIWILGKSAFNTYIRAFYPKRFKSEDSKDDDAMTLWRRRRIPCPETEAWIYPMWHPNALANYSKNMFFEKVYMEDLKWVTNFVDEDKPEFSDWYKDVDIVLDHEEIIKKLNIIKNKAHHIAFDYETTGLKPFNKGHKIVSISIASYYKDNTPVIKTIAFPFCHRKGSRKTQYLSVKKIWTEILKNKNIKKIAHNAKFENLWTRVCLKTRIKGWHFCTQLASYILDERHKSSGLKFQSYVRWGIPDYDKNTKEYLSAETSNAFNKAEKAPLDLLLLYNGIDSLLTGKLYQEQRKELKQERLINTYKFMLSGVFALSELEIEGFPVNKDHFHDSDKKVVKLIAKLEKKLLESEEVIAFKKKFGSEINLESSADIRKILFEVMNLSSEKKTKKGADAVDKNTLLEIDNPWCKDLLDYRKYKKIKSTYVDQFIREINDDDKIHPFFSQTATRTGRSCVAKGTKILAVRDFEKYPKGVPIEEMKKGDYVYCFNNNLDPVIRKVLWAGKTGFRRIVRLHYLVNGSGRKGYLDVTPEHKIRMTNGEYVEARNIVGNDFRKNNDSLHIRKNSILAGVRRKDEVCFTRHTKQGHGYLEHRMIYEHFKEKLEENEVIHHINHNHLDHCLENMQKMTKNDHAAYHVPFTIQSEKGRRNSILRIKEDARNGKIKARAKKGADNYLYLNLSKWQCLRLIAKSKGQPSKTKHDFAVFKNYLEKYGIDHNLVRLRYDKNDEYISRNRLLKLSELGRSKVLKILGHNHYKLLRLYAHYEIDTKRKWANQWGEFVPGNHTITAIEYLKKFVDVYDLEVEEHHNFIANELCVHNSSQNPNSQNIPSRDDESKQFVKKGFVVSDDEYFVEIDYGSLEVRIAACFTKDPVLIDYINDPTTDMHKDTAIDLFKLDKKLYKIPEYKKTLKMLRYHAKNGFIFPVFYGSYWRSCAMNLWKAANSLSFSKEYSVLDYLNEKGISNYISFEKHVKFTEEKFWKKFHVFRKWQEESKQFYIDNGYVYTMFGFRRRGLLTQNMVLNTGIQGTGYQCLLWSLTKVIPELRKQKLKSKIMGQIHDSMLARVNEQEVSAVLSTAKEIMEDRLREHCDWMTVPMVIEVEASELGGTWYDKKAIDLEESINQNTMIWS